MKKLQQLIIIMVVLITILGLAFYWYELRPSQVRKICSERMRQLIDEKLPSNMSAEAAKIRIDAEYKICVTEYGIKG